MYGNSQSTIEPLLVSSRTAAKSLSISERTLFGLTKSGQLPAVRIGRAVRYDVGDIKAFIERTKKISEKSEISA